MYYEYENIKALKLMIDKILGLILNYSHLKKVFLSVYDWALDCFSFKLSINMIFCVFLIDFLCVVPSLLKADQYSNHSNLINCQILI